MPSWIDKIKGRINSAKSYLILILAILQGLLFLFLMPPWQHYDEPGNFEYAWLAANLDHWPKRGEYNNEMRREVLASMIEHDFFADPSMIPDLLATNPPVQIGISQLGDVPLYFFLASLPLRIFRFTDITFPLYAARFVSVILFVVMIWTSMGICRHLFGKDHALTWMVPVFLILLPPFADLMTAVNNDVAAITFSTLFLWAIIRIISRGLNPWRLLAALAALVACLLSKSTAVLALPVFAIVIGFGIYKFFHKRILLYAVTILGCLVVLLLFSWNTTAPAFFYARTENTLPVRIKSDRSTVGDYTIALPAHKESGSAFYQMLTRSTLELLAGRTVTLGVWMWADQPVEIRFPSLVIDNEVVDFQEKVHLEAEPHFFAFKAQLPEKAGLGWLTVYPAVDKSGIVTYWDGLILVAGDYSTSSNPPVFDDKQAASGSWDGIPFSNQLRNASGEVFWPVVRTQLTRYTGSQFNLNGSFIWSFTDPKGTGWYYQQSFAWLFQTFWARFAWTNVSLQGEGNYWIFSVISLISIIGISLAAWHYRKILPWSLIIILAVDLVGIVVISLLRGVGSWFTGLLIPAARYTYPSIILIAIITCGGWYFLFDQYIHKIGVPKTVGFVIFFGGLVTYDILAIQSILSYFRM